MVEASRLAERYLLRDKLAAGGMGTVFVARDERLGRDVAVKLLKEALADDPRFVERFRREARAAGALSHPNVANVFDYGEESGRPFIVMELVRGRDLAWVLRDEGRMSSERAGAICAQIADALEHAHRSGLVHRDIKPHNIIVGDNDRVKVTDFGIARAVGESTLTATGSVLGTAQYISPEQASGTSIGPASDIYSLGIVLYEMLTGAVPFTGDSALAVAMRHVNDEVPSARGLNPGVDADLDAIVRRATAKDPNERFRSAGEMAESLRGAALPAPTPVSTAEITGERTQVLETEAWPFPAHPSPWNAHRLGRIVLGVFAILFLLALAALAYRLTAGNDRPAAGERREQPANQEPQPPPAEEEPEEAPAAIALEDFTGWNFSEAEEVLKDEGLVVERVEDFADGYEKDQVFDQTPEPGTEVLEGDTVTLYVNNDKGESDGEEDEEGGPGGGPPEEPPGQVKKDEDDDD